MSIEVRFKRNKKNAKYGELVQRKIEDLEDQGIEIMELKWIREPFISIHEQVCGFEDYSVKRTQTGTLKKLTRDGIAEFRPDDRGRKGTGVGYAYLPKTERNLTILAGMYAIKMVKVTDTRIEEEIYAIMDKNGWPRVLDLRNKTIDAVLSAGRKEKQILKRNETLKKQIAVARAAEENAELERELAIINGTHVEEVIEDTPIEEEKTEVTEEVIEPVVEEVIEEKPKRKINTKNIKRE